MRRGRQAGQQEGNEKMRIKIFKIVVANSVLLAVQIQGSEL